MHIHPHIHTHSITENISRPIFSTRSTTREYKPYVELTMLQNIPKNKHQLTYEIYEIVNRLLASIHTNILLYCFEALPSEKYPLCPFLNSVERRKRKASVNINNTFEKKNKSKDTGSQQIRSKSCDHLSYHTSYYIKRINQVSTSSVSVSASTYPILIQKRTQTRQVVVEVSL